MHREKPISTVVVDIIASSVPSWFVLSTKYGFAVSKYILPAEALGAAGTEKRQILFISPI